MNHGRSSKKKRLEEHDDYLAQAKRGQFCHFHYERTRVKIPATRLVFYVPMCEACFAGEAIRERELHGDGPGMKRNFVKGDICLKTIARRNRLRWGKSEDRRLKVYLGILAMVLGLLLFAAVARADDRNNTPASPDPANGSSSALPDAAGVSATRKAEWVSLTVAGVGTSFADSVQTHRQLVMDERDGYPFVEHDPLYRPLVHLPAATQYTLAVVTSGAFSLLGYKMLHSRHRWVRSIWWIPQTVQITDSSFGVAYTTSHWPESKPTIKPFR